MFLKHTRIDAEEVTLTNRNSTAITFRWNTTDSAYGNYTISAYIHPVPEENDMADNTLIDCTVFITIRHNVNGEGTADASNLFDLSKPYCSDLSKPNRNPNFDFNYDKVDALNLFDLSKNYGKIRL